MCAKSAIYLIVLILHHMPGRHDVDVFFRHMSCIHRMALPTMRHDCDVARCVLYWFYFLALPFFYPFLFHPVYSSIISDFCKKKFNLILPWPRTYRDCASDQSPHCGHPAPDRIYIHLILIPLSWPVYIQRLCKDNHAACKIPIF